MTAFEPLATLDDLTSFSIDYSGREVLASSLLESVSDAVRDAAGCPISSGTYTVDVPSETSRKLDLPCRPVTNVSSVLLDGTEIDDWRLVGNALYRDGMWMPPGCVPVNVTVTMTAGFATVPRDVVRLVCSFVAAGLSQQNDGGPGSHRDTAYERVDDVQVGYRQGTEEIVDAAEIPRATRDMLRNRFGLPSVSIGVFR